MAGTPYEGVFIVGCGQAAYEKHSEKPLQRVLWEALDAALRSAGLPFRAVQGLALNPTWLVWWPMPPFQEGAVFDPPAWSLFMEAWATLIFPVLFWVTLRGRIFGMALAGLSFALIYVEPRLFCVPFFAIGVAATGFAINWPRRAPGVLLWLGKISYSLYLTHALVMIVAVRAFGSWGAIAVLPAVFGIAWLCWWAIERPSILLSRRVGAAKRVAVQA